MNTLAKIIAIYKNEVADYLFRKKICDNRVRKAHENEKNFDAFTDWYIEETNFLKRVAKRLEIMEYLLGFSQKEIEDIKEEVENSWHKRRSPS